MRISGPIPSHILERMSPQDRPVGKAGMTKSEIAERVDSILERQLHRDCVALCQHAGIVVGHARMDRKSTYTEGWPDLTFCVHGRFYAVELKAGAGKLSDEQVKVMSALESEPCNGRCFVVRSVEEMKQIVKAAML